MIKSRTLWGGAILYPAIWTHLVEDHWTMLHINFQNLSKVVLKKKILDFFYYFYFYFRAILDLGAFIWRNLVNDHYAMQRNKFRASLSQVVLKKIFEYFSMYF